MKLTFHPWGNGTNFHVVLKAPSMCYTVCGGVMLDTVTQSWTTEPCAFKPEAFAWFSSWMTTMHPSPHHSQAINLSHSVSLFPLCCHAITAAVREVVGMTQVLTLLPVFNEGTTSLPSQLNEASPFLFISQLFFCHEWRFMWSIYLSVVKAWSCCGRGRSG